MFVREVVREGARRRSVLVVVLHALVDIPASSIRGKACYLNQ